MKSDHSVVGFHIVNICDHTLLYQIVPVGSESELVVSVGQVSQTSAGEGHLG